MKSSIFWGIEHDHRLNPQNSDKAFGETPTVIPLAEGTRDSIMNVRNEELNGVNDGIDFREGDMHVSPADVACVDLVLAEHRRRNPGPNTIALIAERQ